MLEDNAEIKIIDLPIAGSDDPVLKNFNQAVFNMRDHVSPVAEAVKKFILYSTVLKTSIFFINTVITVLSEDIEEEPAPTEPVQEAA